MRGRYRSIALAVVAGWIGGLCCTAPAGAAPVLTTVGPPFPAHPAASSVAYSPTGTLLATRNYEDDSISTYRVSAAGTLSSTGPATATADGPSEIAFGRNGERLAVASYLDETVQMYAVSDGGKVSQLGSPTPTDRPPDGLALSADGKLLAIVSGFSDTISMFQVADSGELSAVGPPIKTGEAPIGVAFSPDRKLLATANFEDWSVSLFAVDDAGALTLINSADAPYVREVAFSSNGDSVATVGGYSGYAAVSTYRVSASGLEFADSVQPGVSPRTVGFSSDGRFVATVSSNESINMYEVSPTGTLTAVANPHLGDVTFAFSPVTDRMAILDYASHALTVASISRSGRLTLIGAPTAVDAIPQSATFASANDLFAVASTGDHTISLFRVLASGWLDPVGPPMGVQAHLQTAAFTPDARLLVTASHGEGRSSLNWMSTYAVDPDSGLELVDREVTGLNDDAAAAAVSPSGRWVAAVLPGMIGTYSLSPEGDLSEFPPRDVIAGDALAFSAGWTDGEDEGAMAVADLATDSVSVYTIGVDGMMTRIGGPANVGDRPSAVAFSADRRLVASANLGDDTVSMLRLSPGGELTPAGPPVPVGNGPLAIAMSGDGRLLATANSGAATVSLFLVSPDGHLTPLGAPSPTGRAPSSVAFSPDGRWLAVTNAFDDSVSMFALAAPVIDTWFTRAVPGFTGGSVTFEFEASYPSTFECRVDGGAFEACASPTTLTDLAEGQRNIEVRARDLAGKSHAPLPAAWIADRSGPEPFGLVRPQPGAEGAPARTEFAWSSTSDRLSGLDRYDVWVDGAVRATVASDACDGEVCVATIGPLGDGGHEWSVRATDRVGNATDTERARFAVDAAPPASFSLAGPADGSVHASREVALSWQAAVDAGSGIAAYDVLVDDRLAARVDKSQTSVAVRDLADGTHEWRVIARDKHGLERASASRRLRVDTTAPVASLVVGPARFVVPLAVRIDAGASFDPNGGRIVRWEFDVDGDGVFEILADGPVIERLFANPGLQPIAVRVTDEAGHSSVARAHVEGEPAASQEGASYVTIDDGADFTRDLVVELEIRAPPRRGATAMVISNDGRPDESRKRAIARRVAAWPLAGGRSGRDRRIVYVFFYNGAGAQVGERVFDDIRYDPVAPTVLSATVKRLSATRAELRLSARDRVSGLGRVEVRSGKRLLVRRERYSPRMRIPLPWSAGTVRVSVYDRAGNRTTKTARRARR